VLDDPTIRKALRVNTPTLFDRLNFLRAAPKSHPQARDTDIVLSDEILAVSRADNEAIWALLRTSPEGLDANEAEARLASVGPNLIAREAHPSVVQELWGRAKNPLNALLLSLATVSYFLGDVRAAVVIAIMVVLAITTAFIQEHRSNDAAAQLRAMVKSSASVKRRGANQATAEGQSDGFIEVLMERLVPGDVVRLSAGDMIPADLRLLSAKDLFINQAIAGRRELTSFDKGINRFTWLMIRFILVMVPAVFLINGFTKGDWLEALLFAVAVAVGLTPEMLPMIVTVNLAKGAIAMSKKRVIVKRLHAIQNFGAMDVLCTDKTGTLTQDRIILKRHLDIHGNDCERVLE
jgi:Mg2+-importing ATPase